MVKIAQFLVAVEKLSFFKSAILKIFVQFFFFFASFLFKSVTIYVILRMGGNFDDYSDFQQKARGM